LAVTASLLGYHQHFRRWAAAARLQPVSRRDARESLKRADLPPRRLCFARPTRRRLRRAPIPVAEHFDEYIWRGPFAVDRDHMHDRGDRPVAGKPELAEIMATTCFSTPVSITSQASTC